MFELVEFVRGVDVEAIPEAHLNTLKVLVERMNGVRQAYGNPMLVTSGYRTMEHHLEIYRRKGITDISKIPMQSKHLIGAAVDIADRAGYIKTFVYNHYQEYPETSEFWFEDFEYTPTWVHFQIVPYGSWEPGKSIFFDP